MCFASSAMVMKIVTGRIDCEMFGHFKHIEIAQGRKEWAKSTYLGLSTTCTPRTTRVRTGELKSDILRSASSTTTSWSSMELVAKAISLTAATSRLTLRSCNSNWLLEGTILTPASWPRVSHGLNLFTASCSILSSNPMALAGALPPTLAIIISSTIIISFESPPNLRWLRPGRHNYMQRDRRRIACAA